MKSLNTLKKPSKKEPTPADKVLELLKGLTYAEIISTLEWVQVKARTSCINN